MYEVYTLRSLKDSKTYTGYAKNAKKRLEVHNNGKVKATRHRRPLVIIRVEQCKTLKEAKDRERYWKSGAGRRKLTDYFNNGFPPR